MRYGFTAAMFLALSACGGHREAAPRVDVSISELRMGTSTVLEQAWDMKLRVQNPNNFDIPADGIKVTVSVNGKVFAKGVNNRSVLVPRLGEAMIPVQAISDLPKVMNQMSALGLFDAYGIEYTLKGTLYSGERGYPFKSSGKVTPLQ